MKELIPTSNLNIAKRKDCVVCLILLEFKDDAQKFILRDRTLYKNYRRIYKHIYNDKLLGLLNATNGKIFSEKIYISFFEKEKMIMIFRDRDEKKKITKLILIRKILIKILKDNFPKLKTILADYKYINSIFNPNSEQEKELEQIRKNILFKTKFETRKLN